MKFELVKALSNKCTCKNCGITLKKDTFKIVKNEGRGFTGFEIKLQLCLSCGKGHINAEIKALERLLSIIDTKLNEVKNE